MNRNSIEFADLKVKKCSLSPIKDEESDEEYAATISSTDYPADSIETNEMEVGAGGGEGCGDNPYNPFFGEDEESLEGSSEISTVQKRPSYLKVDGSTGLMHSTRPVDTQVIKKLSFFDEDSINDILEEEKLKTYLRIRPTAIIEHGAGKSTDQRKVLDVKDDTTVVAYPKSLGLLKGEAFKQTEFKFTKVLGPECGQSTVFDECVRPLLEKFLKNENCLIFTYGATNSGKTYTLQGHGVDYGIIPRTLDTIFERVQDRLYKNGNIKPHLYQSFLYLSQSDVAVLDMKKEKILEDAAAIKSELLNKIRNRDDHDSSNVTSQDSSKSGSTIHLIGGSNFDELSYALFTGSSMFSIWISFAELYNERVYDLLEPVSSVKTKRRKELKLLQDRNGFVYVKDLTEIHVTSQEEAYKIFLAGRKNLQFAATQMNQKSSRSHSFFTLRVVTLGIGDGLQPFPKSVHRLTFCDLAGLERVHQTENEGARLKESGNINTSLTVLLKVIRILREKQIHKNQRMLETIPFRESKLTHIFKSFLTSSTHICMIVNVNPDPATANSTFQVLHNSAIARNVIVFRPLETQNPLQNKEKQNNKTMFNNQESAKKHVKFAEDLRRHLSSSNKEKKKLDFDSSSESDSASDGECPSIVFRNRLLQQRISDLEKENRELRIMHAEDQIEIAKIREESAKIIADQNRLWSNRLREAGRQYEYFNKRRISLIQNNLCTHSEPVSPGHKCGWNCAPPVVDMEIIKEDSETEFEMSDQESCSSAYI